VGELPVDCLLPSSRDLTSFPPFLTEEIQRCRMGYGFEMNMSGMNFVNALVLVILLISLAVDLQVNFFHLPV
jgi:hypothetical protein